MASSDKVSLTMDKTKAHDAITLALLQRFETAKWAAKQAHDAAINEESVAENKYDTFGLEASYLAHGQSQRVLECQTDWQLFEKKQAVLYGDGINTFASMHLILSLLAATTFIRFDPDRGDAE